jgi:hypothetical protein
MIIAGRLSAASSPTSAVKRKAVVGITSMGVIKKRPKSFVAKSLLAWQVFAGALAG